MNNVLEFLAAKWWTILLAVLAIIALIKLVPRYKVAPPDTALIISGLFRRNYKVRNPDMISSGLTSCTAVFRISRT